MKKIFLILGVISIFASYKLVLAQEDSSGSATIREKVQQKVENALNRPKAYLGTVTDIADSTVQIKTKTGEIKQIAPNVEKIKVVSVGTTSKSVKVSDIAIGDFLVAMGYKNTNEVLETLRILIITPPSILSRKSYQAEITSLAKGEGTVKTLVDGTDVDFEYDTKTKFQMVEEGDIVAAKSSDLEEGEKIIISGTIEKDILLARRILITSQAQNSE